MQYLIDQAAADLQHARQHLITSLESYRQAKKDMIEAHDLGFADSAYELYRAFIRKQAQLRKDMAATQNAIDWYYSVKQGALAEYRPFL